MASLPETVTRICDDLSRPEEEIGDVVKREIMSAVANYESQRFGFNERILIPSFSATNTFLFSALMGSATDVTDIFNIDDIKVFVSNRSLVLTELPWGDLYQLDQSVINSNIPDFWSTFNKTLKIYPKMNTSLSAEITAHVKLVTLTNAVTNAWLVEGEELIRNRATRMVLRKKLDDFEKAAEYKDMEQEAFTSLKQDAAVLQATGILSANY